mmetsp:Transcript_800/g.2172  ORF Transcript_800/g.2172 Transcript_800/m.2172 type:complete len:201 (+) Transcript_800:1186-1788(+)
MRGGLHFPSSHSGSSIGRCGLCRSRAFTFQLASVTVPRNVTKMLCFECAMRNVKSWFGTRHTPSKCNPRFPNSAAATDLIASSSRYTSQLKSKHVTFSAITNFAKFSRLSLNQRSAGVSHRSGRPESWNAELPPACSRKVSSVPRSDTRSPSRALEYTDSLAEFSRSKSTSSTTTSFITCFSTHEGLYLPGRTIQASTVE